MEVAVGIALLNYRLVRRLHADSEFLGKATEILF